MKKLIVTLIIVCSMVTVNACGIKEKVNVKPTNSGEAFTEATTESNTTDEKETTTESNTTVEKETTTESNTTVEKEITTEKETTSEIKTTENITEAPSTTKVDETTTKSEQTTKEKETKEKETKEESGFKLYRYYLDWNPPAGFVSSDGMIYVTESYPMEASNIAYQYIYQSPNLFAGREQEQFFIDFDGQQYEWDLERQYSDTYGYWVEITTTKDENLNIDNGEGRKICMEYMIGEVSINQTQYMYSFNSNRDIFVVTYTIANDEKFGDIFEKNAKEMKIRAVDYKDSNHLLEPLAF